MVTQVRVLHVTAIPDTVTYFLLPLLGALRTSGYAVEIACRDGPGVARLRDKGYIVHPIPFSRRILSPSHVRAFLQLRRLMGTQRYDLVHVHTPIASVLGRLAARACEVPVVVYTAHGFYFHDRMRRVPRRALVWLERFLCHFFTDFLLTVSCEDQDTAIRERFMPPERVLCLKSVGIDLRRFGATSADGTLRTALGLRLDDQVITFVGRPVKEKGIFDLVRAIACVSRAIPRARLLVVGKALSSERSRRTMPKVRRLVRKLGIEDVCVFTGAREDVPAILSISDVFVLPSYREGMPVTVLEAMAAGKPVVATDIRGCREEVVDGVTGLLVPPGDPRSLAKAITALLVDPDRARKLGEEGRRRVEAEFDQERVIGEQVRLYEHLLKEKPRDQTAQE